PVSIQTEQAVEIVEVSPRLSVGLVVSGDSHPSSKTCGPSEKVIERVDVSTEVNVLVGETQEIVAGQIRGFVRIVDERRHFRAKPVAPRSIGVSIKTDAHADNGKQRQ